MPDSLTVVRMAAVMTVSVVTAVTGTDMRKALQMEVMAAPAAVPPSLVAAAVLSLTIYSPYQQNDERWLLLGKEMRQKLFSLNNSYTEYTLWT